MKLALPLVIVVVVLLLVLGQALFVVNEWQQVIITTVGG